MGWLTTSKVDYFKEMDMSPKIYIICLTAILLTLSFCKNRSGYQDLVTQSIASEYTVATVIKQAQDNINQVKVNEYWHLPANSGLHVVSEYYLFMKWFNRKSPHFEEKQLRQQIVASRRQDGSWATLPDLNNDQGSLTTSIYHYWVLKVMGEDPDSAPMRQTRQFILAQGGIAKATLLGKIFLALFNNYPWDELPVLSLLAFNTVYRLAESSFAQWIGPHLLPIAYLRYMRVSKELGSSFNLAELWVEPRQIANQMNISYWGDGTQTLVEKISKLQQPLGSWGGMTTSTLFTLVVFEHYYRISSRTIDNHDLQGQTQLALKFMEDRHFNNGSGSYLGSKMDGRFWDTALVSRALLMSGYPHSFLEATADYLIKNQSAQGGFPFGIDYWNAPDVDDTAEILLVLEETGKYPTQIAAAVKWLFELQNNDGGWGAFARGVANHPIIDFYFEKFKDSADLYDESSPDVTGHVLEALGELGFSYANSLQVRKAVLYLRTQVLKKPVWFGRWGINYLYGTHAAITGLLKVGVSPQSPYLKRAALWIEQHQNLDGGFGESSLSYSDFGLAGTGISTPSQTSWALMALLLMRKPTSPTIQKAVNYLLNEFEKHGKWIDSSTVGMAHPNVALIDYPAYPMAFPLMALGMYQSLKD